jgi:membrane-associated phospholipid phosphatase
VGDLPSVISNPDGRGIGTSTYPSGHVARLVFTLVCITAILPRRWRIGVACGSVLAVAAVMLERVVANAHTATDTVGGLLLGLAVSLSWWAIVTKRDAMPRRADAAVQP